MRHTPRFRRRSTVFRLERLEDRTVLSTLIPVTRDADSGAGSLRQAILEFNSATDDCVIQFDKNVHNITLTGGELVINNINNKGLDIEGPGANKLTISGNDNSRVFDISAGETVTIAGLTIADGLADGNAPTIHSVGGGILNQGDLTLKDAVVSHNQAVGATNDPVTINGLRLIGVGAGGGVANLATLDVSGTTFTGNFVRGADNNNQPGALPGWAMGGGLANGGKNATATVTGCEFTSNLAQGGDGSVVATGVLGAGVGGAIGSLGFGVLTSPGVATLIVYGSLFSNNQAIGGNNNQGRQFAGSGVGGAIATHRLLNLNPGGTATLDVGDSMFDHNQAIGGNHNVATAGGTDPAPNHSGGGAVFVFGTGEIRDSTFRHNQAIGGQGVAGTNGLPITKNGGDARGGAIGPAFPTTVYTLTNVTVEHNQAIGGQAGVGGTGGNGWGGGISTTPSGVVLTITNSDINHNEARGGPADTSGPASHGGEGAGGGVFNISGSTTYVMASSIHHNWAVGGTGSSGGIGGDGVGGGFANRGTATVIDTTVEHNKALGGDGVSGGNGFGGGLYNDNGATLNLGGATVQFNFAVGGFGSGGIDGQGLGGGVYYIGTFTYDDITVIKKNHASTSGDDIYPSP